MKYLDSLSFPIAVMLFGFTLVGCTYFKPLGSSHTGQNVEFQSVMSEGLELPDKVIDTLAKSFYSDWVISNAEKENKLVKDPGLIEPVERVFKNIQQAALRSQYAETAKGFEWDFRVIKDDNMRNAFALPGGKVLVYTGIFASAKNEAGLAAILGHEAIHALARHVAHRITRDIVAGLPIAGLAAGTKLDPKKFRPEVITPIMGALGIGVLVGIDRPFAREMESEADYQGMLLVAEAGYDPKDALRFWSSRDMNTDPEQLQYLSAHPSSAQRLKDLNDRMEEFQRAYAQAPVKQQNSLALLPKILASR
jgi:predicted Zn-dependent protease